jgi:outer membrane protein insertion porin family
MVMLYKIIIISSFFAGFLFCQAEENYELTSISFEGNQSISSSELEEAILSEETPWWFWKFLNSISSSIGREAVYFDSSKIPTDIESLTEYYKANGFFEAEFGYSYEVDTSAMTVALTYSIEEGDPSFYGSYNPIGLDKIDIRFTMEMDNILDIDSSTRFNHPILEENINQSLNVLWNGGYMKARFDSTIIYIDTTVDRADLDIFYSPGIPYYISDIVIDKKGDGASKVDDDLLRKIIDIAEGERYDLYKIRRSQSRLFRTGLFNSVQISALEEETVDDNVPLKLDGNIGKMNELSPEIILNNQSNALNVGLGAQYVRKNFFGQARRFTFKTSFGIQEIDKAFQDGIFRIIDKFSFRNTDQQGYVDSRITIEQPFLFGKPIFGTWENYATINKRRTINSTRFGSKITFEYELPPQTFINFLSNSYNIEKTNEYWIDNDSLSAKLLSIIGVDMGRTTADDLLFPTAGYNISLLLEEANSLPYMIGKLTGSEFGGSLFYKVLLNGSFYWSLGQRDNSILATKLKTGHIQTYVGDFSGIPIDRTLFVGGSNSVRGWRSNQLIPKEHYNMEGLTDVGGSFLLEGSIEYRYRFLENIGAALFYDYGNTWLGYNQFRFDELAQTIGFGFRYYTQIAPFRIDFGFKLYDPNDQKYLWEKEGVLNNFQFHFGIGEAF